MSKTVAALLALLLATPPVLAQQSPPAQKSPPIETAGVKETLGNLWGRLRAVTPRSAPPAATTTTVTAGLRGTEATESELKPYWRGDRDQNPATRKEREALEQAQVLADAGNFAGAAQAYEAFLQQHSSSTLTANARFGAALSRAALGERARATAGFEDFLRRDPQHPLAQDARTALAALR
jgi:TolA-binding protein